MTSADRMPGHDSFTDVPPDFVEAVMRSLASAPLPSPTRAFTSALQDRSTSEARGALSVAWRLIGAGATMPVLVRAQALALLLIVGGSVVGGSAIAAVATYQTVAPILRSIVDPLADEGGIPSPVMLPVVPSAEPSSSLSPSLIQDVAPPDDADAADPGEPASKDSDTGDIPNDEAGDDDAAEPEGGDADPDSEMGEHDEDSGTTEEDEEETDADGPSDDANGGDPEDAEPDDPDDTEPNDVDDAEPDDPDDTEPNDVDDPEPGDANAVETGEPADPEPDDPDRDD